MKNFGQKIGLTPLTLLSGVLLSLLLPPWSFAPAVWICLLPWFFALDRQTTYKSALRQGFYLSIFYGISAFYFLLIGLHNATHISYGAALILSLPLYLFHQPQFLLIPILMIWCQKNSVLFENKIWGELYLILGFAFCYLGIEALLPKLFLDTLGVAFQHTPVLMQAADIGGLPLLTLPPLVTNLFLWRLLRNFRDRQILVAPFVVSAILIGGLWTYGHLRLNEIKTLIDHSPHVLEAVVVQADIDDDLKDNAAHGQAVLKNQILDRYLNLSTQAVAQYPHLDFIMWPETAYSEILHGFKNGGSDQRAARVEAFTREHSKTLVFGGYDVSPRSGESFNSMIIMDTEARAQFYHKNILLPGGEYWPLQRSFPWILHHLPKSSNFSNGPGPSALQLPTSIGDVTVNAVICYEGIFYDYALIGARLGSQLILNITDDSWFEPSNEPQAHLDRAVFSSVMTRLPQIRATNSGISALILPTGEIVGATELHSSGLFHYYIPLTASVPTAVKLWGNWFSYFCIGIGLLFVTSLALKRYH